MRPLPAVLLGALALVAGGCSGGDDAAPAAAPPPAGTDRASTAETSIAGLLPLMPLPADELGETAAGLAVDPESGPQPNAEAATDSLDPDDTEASLTDAGRIDGYDLTYADPQAAAISAGEGIISVGTDIDLFDTSEDASAWVGSQADDFARLEGTQVQPGLRLAKVETFAVDGVGDGAEGLIATVEIGGTPAYGTTVGFSSGPIVGSAFVIAADGADRSALVRELALALERRIESVLAGTVAGEPVPLPAPAETGAAELPPEPPPGSPDLAAATLALEDLPPGAMVAQEGYVEPENVVASFAREFDLTGTRVGDASLIGLQARVEIFEGVPQAAATLATLPVIFTGDESEDFLRERFGAGAGLEPTSIRVEELPADGLGEEAHAFHATFDTETGSFEAFFAFVRVGRAVASLFTAAPGGEATWDDVRPLALAQARRLEDAFGGLSA